MLDKMVKVRNKKGFTLMEMLIVVAIIAILVAVSIPVFTSQLNKAKVSTDQANQRAAKAVAAAMYLTDADQANSSGDYIYDAVNGKLASSVSTGYGKSTDVKDNVLNVTITDNGDIYMKWVAAGTAPVAVAQADQNLV